MPSITLLKQIEERTGTQDSRAALFSPKDIPIGEISIKTNVRKEYEGIEELKASIMHYGLLQPITIYKEGEGYIVKIGHRRFKAYQLLYQENPDRYNTVRCIVADNENVSVIQLIENTQRVDLSQRDLYDAINLLREEGKSLNQIAEIMGKSEKYIKNISSAVNDINDNPSLLAHINTDAVTLQDIAETAGIADNETRQRLLKARGAGLPRQELRKRVKKARAAENGGSPAGGTTPVAPPEVTALFDQMKIEVSFKEINGQAFDTFVSILRKNVKDITKEIGKMHV
jgi:ParB family chromosome partitioning protein